MKYSRSTLFWKHVNYNSYLASACILLLVGGMFSGLLLPQLIQELKLTFGGEIIKAAILNKDIAALQQKGPMVAGLFAHGGRNRRHYYLTYGFTIGGKQYQGRTHVSKAEYDAAQLGQPIAVRYLPGDPQVSRAGNPIWLTGLMIPLGIGLTAGGSSIVLFVRGIRDVRQKVQLTIEGQPALGRIDAVEITRRKGRHISSVKYSYIVEQQGEYTTFQEDLTWSIPYKVDRISPGDLILVLHDRDDVRLHVIDAFGARSEDKDRLLAEATRLTNE